jgi:hypothetical protein
MKPYTCSDFRKEMILNAWRRQAAGPGLSPADKRRLEEQIRRLEKEMGLND